MSEPNINYSFAFSVTVIGLFVWEHIGRLKNWSIRPSVPLQFTSDQLSNLFNWSGKQFAILSSFLTFINLDETKKTLYDLVKPILGIIVSPYYFIKGYIDKAITYDFKTWQIYLGSACIFFFVIALIWYLNKRGHLKNVKNNLTAVTLAIFNGIKRVMRIC